MRRRFLRVPLLLVACTLCLSLAATSRAEEGEPTRGAILNLTSRWDLAGFDPTQLDDEANRMIALNVYDQLYEVDYRARPLKLRPLLAESLPKISEDRTTYTIPLRKDVRFLDDACFPQGKGRLLTAHDVVFCFKRLMDKRIDSKGVWVFGNRIAGMDAFQQATAKARALPAQWEYTEKNGFPEVEGLKAIDDHTLQIKLTSPWRPLPWMLAQSYTSIYAPEAVGKYKGAFDKHLVGSGPYMVETMVGNQFVIFQRNPQYRKIKDPEGRPLPRTNRVAVHVYTDGNESWIQFRNGMLDLLEVPSAVFHSVVDWTTGTLRKPAAELGITLERVPYLEIQYDAFNMTDPVLGHPAGEKGRALRQAICLAIDDKPALEHIYAGRAERVYGPILPEFPEYDPDFVNESLRQPKESPEEAIEIAKEVLEEAGIDPKQVPPIKIDTLDDASSRMIFRGKHKNLEAIGLRLEAKKVTWAQMQERIRLGRCQMWTISWYADYPDAENYLQLFYSKHIPDPNSCGYTNPAYDKLYEAAANLPAGEKRTDLYRQMQQILGDDAPWRFRFRRVRSYVRQPWLGEYVPCGMHVRFWQHVTIDGPLKAAERLKRR